MDLEDSDQDMDLVEADPDMDLEEADPEMELDKFSLLVVCLLMPVGLIGKYCCKQ